MTGELHEISRAIGSLEQGVKSLGRSVDQLRSDNETELREIRQSIETLKASHHRDEGARRTLAILWGGAGGIVAAIFGVIATKLGLK